MPKLTKDMGLDAWSSDVEEYAARIARRIADYNIIAEGKNEEPIDFKYAEMFAEISMKVREFRVKHGISYNKD